MNETKQIYKNEGIKKRRPVTTQSLRPKRRKFGVNPSNAIKDSSFYGSSTTAQPQRM